MERHSNIMYISKLHIPTCPHVNVVVFSVIALIVDILSLYVLLERGKSGPAPIMMEQLLVIAYHNGFPSTPPFDDSECPISASLLQPRKNLMERPVLLS